MHTHKRADVHAHTSRWGQSCKRSGWHCGTSLAALCRCRLHTGFWINGSEMIYRGYLPPEHRHARLPAHTHTLLLLRTHTHNTNFFPPSLLFTRRRWRKGSQQNQEGKREKSGREASFCVLSHWISEARGYVKTRLPCLFSHSCPFVSRHDGKCCRGHAEKSQSPRPPRVSSVVCKIIKWNIRLRSNKKRCTYRSSSTGRMAQGKTSGSQQLLSPTSHMQSPGRREHLFVFVIKCSSCTVS